MHVRSLRPSLLWPAALALSSACFSAVAATPADAAAPTATAATTTPTTAPAAPVPAITVTTAQGQAVQPASTWRTPAAARMQFEVQGRYKGFAYSTSAQLDWLPQGERYEASQQVKIPIAGIRRQSSVGRITPQGLVPEIFMDVGRRESSTTFDAHTQQVLFSRGAQPVALQPGMQDRLSVFFQVGGMIAADPSRYPQGTDITVQAASNNKVAPWTFRVQSTETLQLGAGRIQALKLQHLDKDSASNPASLESALWLAPSLGYVPVRIRMVEGPNDELDLRLKSHTAP